jgi:hypothetical protein
MVVASAVGWPDVFVALIAAPPAYLAAWAAFSVRRSVRTTNGHTLGETVEHVHEKAVETNAVVKELSGELTGEPHGAAPKDAAASG